MKFGMSRQDYRDLHCPARVANGPELKYPLRTVEVTVELRRRGYDATYNLLMYVRNEGVVDPSGKGRGSELSWSEADIDIVADYCEKNQHFMPHAGCDPAVAVEIG